jgi:hypothetical protein
MSRHHGAARRCPTRACQRLAEQMLSLALKAGADGAEVLVRDGSELEVKIRLGEPELVKEAGSRALGLRVIKDQRAAVTYTSDFSREGMARLARDTVELAALAEPDPHGAICRARGDGPRDPRAGAVGRGGAGLDVTRGHAPGQAGRGGGAEARTSGSPTRRGRCSGG